MAYCVTPYAVRLRLLPPPLTVDLDENFTHLVEGDVHERYQYISWDVIEDAKWNENYILDVKDGASFTVEGNTKIHQYAPHSDGEDDGSYAVHTSGGEIYLLGNVDIVSRHQEHAEFGANAVYAKNSGRVELGSKGTTTRVWSIENKPDAISAKAGGTVVFQSEMNQVVGSMDFLDGNLGGRNSSISGIFSGEGAYWFGDEQSWANAIINDIYEYHECAGKDISEILNIPNIPGVDLPEFIIPEITDSFDLTFKNGAQWTYFGISDSHNGSIGQISGNIKSIPKRISAIRLEDGGIINLFDKNIKDSWKALGLLDIFKELEVVKHDYVRIGDLKGSGGIFRLDLNSDERSESDVIYVEGSTDPGMHYIEPYNLDALRSISPENELIFALVAKDVKVTFADKQNLFGETLFDYELEIGSEDIDSTDELSHEEELQGKYEGWSDFNNGTKWVIKNITFSDSAAVRGMTGAGWASYGAAVEMDRRDRRLTETSRNQEDPNSGLWIRATHGRAGATGQYRWDRDGFTLGFDRKISEGNRLGMWFSYSKGNTELLDVDDGNGDMERYELALYDTLTFGSHYLDFVGRFGRVSSEFSTVNPKYTTSGDYDQDYLALSAEYGYTLKDVNTGVFIEPQVQAQVAWLDSYDYSVQRTMSTDVDSATSVIGRIGLRAGRAWSGETCAGEIYIRGDVLHQLTDGQDVTFKSKTDVLHRDWGDFGTWATFGIGGFATWKNCLDFQFDVEKTEGSEIDDTWLLSGRMNYRF